MSQTSIKKDRNDMTQEIISEEQSYQVKNDLKQELNLFDIKQEQDIECENSERQTVKEYFQNMSINNQTFSLLFPYAHFSGQNSICQQQTQNNIIIQEYLSGHAKKSIQIELRQELLKNNFVFIQSNQSTQKNKNIEINVKVIQHMKSFQVIQILCQLGNYAKKYQVLYVFQDSWRHNNLQLGFGSYGSVFQCEQLNRQKFVVKCLSLKSFDAEYFLSHFKEFFIADMMSAIQTGPKMSRRCGFDFIVFKGCMQFDMELCQNIRKETLKQDLTINLMKMHMLKIVHSDIKPQNMMYSPSYKKNVFLDFGIAGLYNNQIWNKVSTRFKGTYQFCGQQMKKTYSNPTSKRINMYLNDTQMLRNSLKNIETYSCKHSEYGLDEKHRFKCKQQQSNEKYIKQLVVKIKYLIYGQNDIIKERQQFEEQINALDSIDYNGDKKQKAFQQIFDFINQFKQNSKNTIFNQYIWNCKKFQNLSISHSCQASEENENYKKLNSNLRNFINFNLKSNSLGKNKKAHQSKNRQNIKNQKNNLEYILLKPNQILKFTQDNYIEMFLKYVSFWGSCYNVSILQKQIVATVFRSKHQIQSQKQFVILQENYLPSIQFIIKSYPNLVWSYTYLLKLYMQIELDQITAGRLMVILKDCIILSFNYPLFIGQYFTKYFTFLISKKSSTIVTKVFTQVCELVFLSDKHFLVSKSNSANLYGKDLKIIIQASLENVVQQELQKNQMNQQFMQKLKTILKLWKVIKFRKRKICQYDQQQKLTQQDRKNLQNLINIIQKQFFTHKQSLTHLKDYLKAVRLIYHCQKQPEKKQINVPKSLLLQTFQHYKVEDSDFDVVDFNQIINSKKIAFIVQFVKYIEKKINCEEISFYFLIHQKIILYHNNPDPTMMFKICKTLFIEANLSLLLLNFRNYIEIVFEYQLLDQFLILKLYSQCFFKKRQLTYQLLEFFSLNIPRYTAQIYLCLLHYQISNSNLQNQLKNYSKQKNKYYQILQKIYYKTPHQKQFKLVFLVAGSLILEYIIEIDFQKYLQFRLSFFTTVYQVGVKTSKQSENILISNELISQDLNQFKLQNYSYELKSTAHVFHSFSYIFPYIEVNALNFPSSSNYYKIIKLKKTLFSDVSTVKYQQAIVVNYLIQKNYLQLFQFLISLCTQYFEHKSIETFRTLFTSFDVNRELFDSIELQQMKKILEYVDKFQKSQHFINSSHSLFPIYLNIIFHPIFYSDLEYKFQIYFYKTSKLLYQFSTFYNSKPLFKLKTEMPLIFDIIKLQLLIVSIKYLQVKKIKRKQTILIMQMIKAMTQVDQAHKKIAKMYIDDVLNVLPDDKINRSLLKRNIKRLFINRCADPNDYTYLLKDKDNTDKQFDILYNFFFSPVKESWSYYKVTDWSKLYKNSDQQKNQREREIVKQTIEIRNKIQYLEYQILCKRLQKQKGKKVEQLSWINVFNK